MVQNSKVSTDSQSWDANIHYKDTAVAARYDAERFSSIAGRVFNNLERKTILRAFSDVAPGARIADVPCGTGRLAETLLEEGYQVHGMDIAAEMLEVASQRVNRFGDRFTTEVVDAKNLAVEHEKYDAVLCARVLMHFKLEEQIEFLRGVAALTSGVVVISQSLNSPYQHFRRWVKNILGHQESARYPITSKEIDRLLAGAGLREVRRHRLNSLISEAVYIVAKKI